MRARNAHGKSRRSTSTIQIFVESANNKNILAYFYYFLFVSPFGHPVKWSINPVLSSVNSTITVELT